MKSLMGFAASVSRRGVLQLPQKRTNLKGKTKKMKAKLMMMGVAAALATGAMAEITNTVKVTKFHQSHPYSGKATVEYAVGGVQLWENGPYWAECNVGATKPKEYGYYFWWGDTVGYKRKNGAWVASDGSTSSFTFSSGNAPTCNKNNAALLSAGYIDSTGNLAAAHDAATAHLGSPWRMPTSDEIQALVDNCTTTWITTNGVYGRLVTGKGTYANRSIFLPAAGYGDGSYLLNNPDFGYFWSSTPNSGTSNYAWRLDFDSSDFHWYGDLYRYCGQSVRPVRGFAE